MRHKAHETKIAKGLSADRLRAQARRLHAVLWFEEAEDKRRMVKEWNALYPSAKITMKKMMREFGKAPPP